MIIAIASARAAADSGGLRIATSTGRLEGASAVKAGPGTDLLLDASTGLFFIVAHGQVAICPTSHLAELIVDPSAVPALKQWLAERGKAARAGKAA